MFFRHGPENLKQNGSIAIFCDIVNLGAQASRPKNKISGVAAVPIHKKLLTLNAGCTGSSLWCGRCPFCPRVNIRDSKVLPFLQSPLDNAETNQQVSVEQSPKNPVYGMFGKTFNTTNGDIMNRDGQSLKYCIESQHIFIILVCWGG